MAFRVGVGFALGEVGMRISSCLAGARAEIVGSHRSGSKERWIAPFMESSPDCCELDIAGALEW